MAAYTYSDTTWTPHPTFADGNCFFHALFGELASDEDNDNLFYFDRHVHFRRMLWSVFLMFFRHQDMPDVLLEVLQNCFLANDNLRHMTPGDPEDLDIYIRKVALGEHWVYVEEIPVLATLWNVRVVLFLGVGGEPRVFEPNQQLRGNFPFSNITPLQEGVIRLVNNHFEKLCSVIEPNYLEIDIVETEMEIQMYWDSEEESEDPKYAKKSYKKGGSAGIQGGLYQITVLSMILMNALKKWKVWQLSTENEAAAKFDDLIIESPHGDILLQAKHKEGKKKIGYNALMTTSPSNFSLAKYYASFQEVRSIFNVRNIIICTNSSLQTDRELKTLLTQHTLDEDNVLHFKEAKNIYYTFNEDLVPDLKKSIQEFHKRNMPNVKLCICDEDIKEFLSRLQFFINYLDKNNFDRVVDSFIPSISLAENLDSKETFKFVHGRISEWFMESNGRYIHKLDAKSIFCDMRSLKYCEELTKYEVTFKSNSNFVNIVNRNKILNIAPAREPVLSLVKLYQFLESDRGKAIFLDPNDSLDIQRQFVDVFSIERYKYFVVFGFDKIREDVSRKMCAKFTKILNKFEYKKLLIVAEEKNDLVRRLRESDASSFQEIREDIKFEDLRNESQEKLATMENIEFQGTDTSLRKLINENLNNFVDAVTLAKLAKNDKIVISTKLKHADEDIESYYIYRNLKRNEENIKELEIQGLGDFRERIVLISDSAGMGKTTILTNLGIKIKNNHSSLWVIRIDLNNCSNTFKSSLKERRKSLTVDQLLNDQEATKLDSEFAKRLFQKEENVVLMLDAVDEVSPSYMELVMAVMDDAKARKNFVKIFVTTRPHLCEDLEEILEVSAFSLDPFSKWDQVDFLTRYWTQKLGLEGEREVERCKEYAWALINEMSRWIDEDSEDSFAGIPLQTRMLAEVFQERKNLSEDDTTDWEECKEFLSSDKDEPHLPRKINLIQLYELFISKKRTIFVEEKGKTEGNTLSENALVKVFEDCHAYHRSLALPIIFYWDECHLFRCFRPSEEFSDSLVNDYVLRAGIVQKVDGKVNFIHRTFAEYFAAQCLILELKQGSLNKLFIEFLLDEILIRDDFHVVRAFFDSFIQKELSTVPKRIPDDTFESFSEVDYASILGQSRNSYLHLFAREGAVGIMEFFITCVGLHNEDDREFDEEEVILVDTSDLECNTPLHDACFYGHLHIATTLIKKGANVNLENAAGDTPLHIAALKGHLDLVEYLVDTADADLKKVNSYGESVLHCACRGGHIKVVEFLIEHGVDYRGTYTTALHIASSGDHLDIVQYLVEETGADVDILDVNNSTPLHAASHEGNLTIIAYLVEKNCDVNVVNGAGRTAFHDAAYRGLFEVVSCLLENGADLEITDGQDYTIKELLESLKSDTESEEEDESDDEDKSTSDTSEEDEGDHKSTEDESEESNCESDKDKSEDDRNAEETGEGERICDRPTEDDDTERNLESEENKIRHT